jgi:hypothetical protein
MCFKSLVLPISHNFTQYLLEDGVFMPEEDPEYEQQSDEEEETKSTTRSVDKEKLLDEAIALRSKITEFIKNETSSGAFVKLNWSAPRDASWMNPTL